MYALKYRKADAVVILQMGELEAPSSEAARLKPHYSVCLHWAKPVAGDFV